MSDERDIAGVLAPPPLIYGGALVAGVLASRRYPVRFPRISRPAGWTLTAAGAGVAALGVLEFRRAGTSVDPYRPSTSFVSGGPYRFSRNPDYLGLTLLYAGVSLLVRSPWSLALLPGVLAVMSRGVIEREERYLEERFGEEYRLYKERVRRWI